MEIKIAFITHQIGKTPKKKKKGFYLAKLREILAWWE